MSLLLTQLKDKYIELRGFHTSRKLVVIESDDWGSIRMPSRSTFEKLRDMGDSPEKDAFLSNDCLENEDDLRELYNVLASVKDSKGHPAIMTMNFAMANPDFDNIDPKSGVYAYEPFYKTYDRYYGKNNILSLINEGMDKGYVLPQLHCREHMNVNRWIKALKEGRTDAIMAYENKTIGVGASFSPDNIFGYMDAFNTDCSNDDELEAIVIEANKMFKESFGFDSETFVASCFVWGGGFEKSLGKLGIKFMQTSPWQYAPVSQGGEYKLKRKLHFTGEKSRNGQMYSVRNCVFEPAYKQDYRESVDTCLAEIERSFKAGKPAIITSHRLNYIGSIRPENRDQSLNGLRKLLTCIVERYPDVEFVSSAELFSIMTQEKR